MDIKINKYGKCMIGGLITLLTVTSIFCGEIVKGNDYEETKAATKETKYIKTEAKEVQSNVQEDTVYGIGSVSKMFVTTAIMQLVEEGKIDLDYPVTSYLPEFQMADERYKDITVRMLLNHSSGLMGSTFSNNILYNDNDQMAHDTFLQKLKNQRLKANPGQYGTYCNDGFVLAELVVEHVSGESFTDYLRNHICGPLGMKQSGTSIDFMNLSNQASVYFNRSILYANEYCNVFGTGGLLSTAEEVCKFGQTFMRDNNGLLSNESLEEMKKPAAKTNSYGYVTEGSCDNYGLGWDSVDAYPFCEYGITTLVKGGDLLNQHGVLMVMPDENVSVSVLSSGGSSTFNELLAGELAQIVLEEKGVMNTSSDMSLELEQAKDEANEPISVPNEYLKYEGSYANAQGIYQLSFKDDEYLELKACDTETEKIQKYYYIGEGKFTAEKGCYINGIDLDVANGNQNGISNITLKTEKDGKEYIVVDSTVSYAEVGDTKFAGMFAEKIEPLNLSDNTLKAWQVRDGKKYYLVSEKYSSAFWNMNPVIKVKLSTETEGYINASGRLCTTKITDANHSKAFVTLTGGAGRDLTDVSIHKVNGIEEVDLEDIAIKYVGEEAVSELDLSKQGITLEQAGALWYKIKEEDAKKEVYITPSDKMAIYVYNQYDECTYSSYMLNMGNRIILPEGGKVAVVGEAGSRLDIKQK